MALGRAPKLLPAAVIAAIAIAIAWGFAVLVLRTVPRLTLPLDDSYIYLTYAKQFGRGEPFSYFPGGGYSAGSTSALWPIVLAPFWTLGARGHALVWVSFLVCSALYALSAIGVWRVVKKLGGGDVAGVVAALVLLGIGPYAWTSLSGMEVAFASCLLVATIALLVDQPPTGPPSRRLGVCLAAASLSRPEAMMIVFGVVGIAVLGRLRRRDPRAALWWLAPLAVPLAWLVANRAIAGQFMPNTGVAKSYFYLPGFDWTYYVQAIGTATRKLLVGVFYDDRGPLVWPKVIALLYVIGSVRVVSWARRARRPLAGALIVLSPLAMMLAVVASSGLWSFQNYRYIGPAFALLAIPVGFALAPRSRAEAPRALVVVVGAALVIAVGFQLAPNAAPGIARWAVAFAPIIVFFAPGHAREVALALGLGAYSGSAVPSLRADARLFAQGAQDVDTQVVRIGEYIHRELPDATVMFHDAGAIAYFGDGKVYDMLGLVTNHQAGIANHGAGARFEFLESLPASRRPTHFAYYPDWLGTAEFYGDVLLQTPLRPRVKGLTKTPLVGAGDMQVIVATFDHVGTGERPLEPQPGWHVVDRVDIADLASERAHGWRGTLGRRNTGDPTSKWSFVGRETGARGLVLDGGRTMRVAPDGTVGERFAFEADPARPVRLVLRTGGQIQYPFQDAINRPVALTISAADGRELARTTLPAPPGAFVEVPFELPAGTTAVAVTAVAPYRVFHWFVLQPD